jgi:hypothetical protein
MPTPPASVDLHATSALSVTLSTVSASGRSTGESVVVAVPLAPPSSRPQLSREVCRLMPWCATEPAGGNEQRQGRYGLLGTPAWLRWPGRASRSLKRT